MRCCLNKHDCIRGSNVLWGGIALAYRRILELILAYRRDTELPHSGVSPQQGKGQPSRDPDVILVPPRDRVKVEWCLVPYEICVELPGLMHYFQSCVFVFKNMLFKLCSVCVTVNFRIFEFQFQKHKSQCFSLRCLCVCVCVYVLRYI